MSLPNTTAPINRADRLRIIQTMQSILEAPASPELKAFVDRQLADATDPQLIGFLRLLATDNEANRARAKHVFDYLERQIHVDDAKESEARAAAEPPRPPAQVEAALASASNELTPHALNQPTDRAVHGVPFLDPTGALEVIRYTMHDTNEVRDYSIITSDTTAEQLGNTPISRVVAVVVGIEGQRACEHGFGWVLALPAPGLALDYTLKQRCIMPMAMGYPGAIGIYDDHKAPHLPGVSHFMAVHEAMSEGYHFLLDMEIIPINNRFALSMKPHHFIERQINGQPDRVSSAHLRKLLYACEKLGIIGFLGEVEVS